MSRDLIVENVELCNKYYYNVKSLCTETQNVGSMFGMQVNKLVLSDNTSYEKQLVETIVSSCINSNAGITIIEGKLGSDQTLQPLIEMMHMNDQLVALVVDSNTPTPLDVDWVICKVDKVPFTLHEKCFVAEFIISADKTFDPLQIPEDLQKPPWGNIWVIPKNTSKKLLHNLEDKCKNNPFIRLGLDLKQVL